MSRRSVRPWAVLAMILLGDATTARAQTSYSWNTTVDGANWNVAGNWTPGGGPPVAADSATISIAGTYSVALTDNRSINNVTINNANATLDHQSGGSLNVSGTIALTAGTYMLTGGLISGGSITSGGGTLRPGAATATRLNNVSVGAGVLDFSTNFSSLRLLGTSNLAAGTVALNGSLTTLAFEQTTTLNSLTFNISGSNSSLSVDGTNTLTLGSTSTITATNAASIRSDFVTSGSAVFQNQGLIQNTGTGLLTINPDSFVNQSGGIVRATSGTIQISPAGGGEINQSGGTFDVNGGTLTLGGPNWDNNGTITLSSGTLNLGATTTANYGTISRTGGAVNITGALTNTGATLVLTAATGSYTLSNTSITGGSITAAGGAALRVGGALVFNGNRLIDVAVGAGVLNFSDPSARVTLRGTSNFAAGTVLDLNGGGMQPNILAFDQLATGNTTTLTGVTVNLASNNATLSVDGTGTVTLAATSTITASGTARIDGFSGITGNSSSGTGTFVNQGTIQKSGTGIFDVRPDVLTNNGTMETANGTIRVLTAGVTFTNIDPGNTLTGGTYRATAATGITSVLDFQTRSINTIAPATTVELNGVNTTFNSLNALTTNNGTLSVLGGRVFAPTAGALANAGLLTVGQTAGDGSTVTANVTVNSGGKLQGNGTVTGAVTANLGGTVAPGTSPGRLTVTGNADFQPGSTLGIQLGGTTDTDADRSQLFSSAGTLTFAGTGANPFTVDVTKFGSFAESTATYTIALFNSIGSTGLDGAPVVVTQTGATDSGTNANNIRLQVSGFSSGATFTLSRSGNLLVLSFVPVPEPATVLGVLLAGFGVWRIRAAPPEMNRMSRG